ncbi:hypothetical protein [Lentzea cavernae]|uniref:Barstar (Barnase inhibitor) n=1 Tax=Lentzea cavernae TaxID=2020703 RepID=A0ABQ3MKQ7_9PSEU|nr:hypothetical protein [Lentzea cavernae]GHH48396.1 hypothetical protein GCM10017774_54390 [Lentzea cavernae]
MPLPIRYEVVRHIEGYDEEVLVRAVDADGLFTGEVLPDRELLVFRGVLPETAARFGELVGFDVYDGPHHLQRWTFEDIHVHAVTPDGEVFASASLLCQSYLFDPLPDVVTYWLLEPGTLDRECTSIDGFPRKGHDYRVHWPPVRLIGCEVAEPTRQVIERPHLWEGYAEYLRALDVHGDELATVPFGLDITDVRRSPLGAGLLDLTFAQTAHFVEGRTFPKAGWRPVWELWRESVPAEPGLWSRYGTEGRSAWLALLRHGDDRPQGWGGGGVFHVDGRHVTDTPSLYLALNEGLLGPGRLFGRTYWEVEEHLRLLCCGPVPGDTTVVWHHSDVARHAVAEEFDWIVATLRLHVDLVLEPSTSEGEA